MRTPVDALRSLQRYFGEGLHSIDAPEGDQRRWRAEIAKTDGRFKRPQVNIALVDTAAFADRPAGRVDYRRPVTVQAFCREAETPHDAMLEGMRVEHLLERLLLDGVGDGRPNRIPLHDFTDGRAAAATTGEGTHELRWAAVEHGVAGNGIEVRLEAPTGPDEPLTVARDDLVVTVTLAGDPAGEPASSAGEVADAIADDDDASALVVAEPGDDATGLCAPEVVALAGGGAIAPDEPAQPAARRPFDFMRVDDVTIGPPIADPQERRLVMVPATFFVMWSRRGLLLEGTTTQATVTLRSDPR